MAMCASCRAEMLVVDGCAPAPLVLDVLHYLRIPYGREKGYGRDWRRIAREQRCHDCNVTAGHFRHARCDVEQCPRCGGQLICCGCLTAKQERQDRV